MTDVINFTKKAFTWSVVVMTIAWSLGLAALAPLAANAAECPALEAGNLFTVEGTTAVYLVNADMERMYFPNSDVYHTWYSDFSGVVQNISTSCTSAYPNSTPGGVNYRPGSRLVKVVISPEVYAVGPGNMRHLIGDGEEAAALYGDSWTSLVRDVHDFHWTNYTTGAEVDGLHDGMLVMEAEAASTAAAGDVYLVEGGMLKMVDGDLPAWVAGDVHTVSSDLFGALSVEGSVTAASVTADPAQGAGGGSAPVVVDPETPVVVGGDVTVSLSANTPVAGNVVINVDNIVFTKVVLKAGDKDAVVNSVKVGRSGLGATGDFTSVTLYDGATKLGSTKTSWHSDGYMTYNIGGGWKIPAGTSKVLTITGKLNQEGTYNALGVLDVALASGGTASGVPVTGSKMTGVNVAVGGVTIANMGSNVTKKIGSTDVTLATFKLTVSSTEDGIFKSITLKNKAASGNAADTDIANLSLYMGSTLLAGPVSMVSDKVTFVLDEADYVAIAKSKNEVFKVVGDVVNGSGNYVQFLLDATTDLVVSGKTYSTNLSVHSNVYDTAGTVASPTDGYVVTIDGAELNIAYTGTNKDTIDDVTDVDFGTLTLSAGSTDIKVTTLKLTVTETNGDSDATNNLDVDEFELVDSTGGAYSGTMTDGGDTNADAETWTFTDEIYLNAGESRTFTMYGDLPNGIGNGDTYKVTATINTTNVVAETVPAGDSVSNFSIGSFTGKTVTVKSPTLKLSGTSLGDETVVVNDTDVILYKGTMEAQADDIKITYVDFNSNSTFASGHWTEVGLYTVDADGAYVLQQNLTSSDMSSSTSLSGQALAFDSLDFTVMKGPSKKVTFVVKGTVASSVTSANGLVNQIKLDYVTGKASDNGEAAVNAGTAAGVDDLATADNDFLTDGGRAVTLADKGTLKIQMRNADSGYHKDRILLAGTSAWVGKLKLIASNEDVKVKDLKLTNATADDEDSVSSVCLYKAQSATAENLISCQNLGSDDVVFYDDIDEVVTMGTQYWYIYVNTHAMNNGALGTADSHDVIQLKVTTSTADSVVAEGVRSGVPYVITDDASVDAGDIAFDEDNDDTYDEAAEADATTSTRKFAVAGTKLSNVAFVSSHGGETVNTSLSGTGEYVAAIVAVTAETTSNTDSDGNALQTLLTGIRFDVDKYVSTSISAVTIKKISGLDAAGTLTIDDIDNSTTTSGTALDTDLAALLPNDHKVQPGTTAYFVVKATVDNLNNDDNVVNWFRFDFDDVKGTYNSDTNESVTWKDGYSATAFQALLLDTESITGTKVAEAS